MGDAEKLHARWLRKARRVFALRQRHDGKDFDRQCDAAADLARDVWRTLDPRGFRRPR